MKIFFEKLFKEIGVYFFAGVLVFLFSFLLGLFFVHYFPESAMKSFEELSRAFSPLLKLSPLLMGVFIFLNNSLKIFLFLVLGIFFGLPTILFLLVNGWVLGFVVGISYPELGFFGIFNMLFYHGIFEFTALFIGAALGFRLGIMSFKSIKKLSIKKIKNIAHESKEIKSFLLFSLNVYWKIILPLLFIAAIIETYLIFKG